jgi:hypothetical protein
MKRNTLLLFVAVLIAGCYPATRITGSWKNPGASRKYKSVFVATLMGNAVAKAGIEDELAAALNARGISTRKSMEEFPPSYRQDSVSKEVLLGRVKSGSADAILTVSVLKNETETRHVSGGYAPMNRWDYYNNFWGYYNHWYPYAYSPDYYRDDEIYYLETNLYDADTEVLLWSAQSRTNSYQ